MQKYLWYTINHWSWRRSVCLHQARRKRDSGLLNFVESGLSVNESTTGESVSSAANRLDWHCCRKLLSVVLITSCRNTVSTHTHALWMSSYQCEAVFETKTELLEQAIVRFASRSRLWWKHQVQKGYEIPKKNIYGSCEPPRNNSLEFRTINNGCIAHNTKEHRAQAQTSIPFDVQQHNLTDFSSRLPRGGRKIVRKRNWRHDMWWSGRNSSTSNKEFKSSRSFEKTRGFGLILIKVVPNHKT